MTGSQHLHAKTADDLRSLFNTAIAIRIGGTWVRICNFSGCIPEAANDPTPPTRAA